jgi:plasmid stabilization system protein ParE
VSDLDERLEAAEDALTDLASDYLASGSHPSRRPSEDEMYRVWIHVRQTLEVLAVLHGRTPKDMANQANEYAPTSEEWASRYASWMEAAREEEGK